MNSTSVWDCPTPRFPRPAHSQWSKVTSLFAAPWVLNALDKIAGLSQLAADWDGYGSPRIDPGAIAEARRFVASVAFDGLPVPSVSPVLGGSVGLQWRYGGKEVEFTFHPSGEVEFLKVLGHDLDHDENMETGTLWHEPGITGLKLLLWLTRSR
jgi:hypothetical protein